MRFKPTSLIPSTIHAVTAATLAGVPLIAQNGGTNAMSVTPAGVTANQSSYDADVTADGRFVLFESTATDLVANDTNGAQDIFRRDRFTGQTERVSIAFDGSEANGSSYQAGISDDGRYVIFESDATNIVAGDTNGVRDVFRRDTWLGSTIRVSLTNSGGEANSSCRFDGVSSDGTQVAFFSGSSNLVPGAYNGWPQIYVRDLTAGTTIHVSKSTGGASANPGQLSSLHSVISGDGNVVAFTSLAGNLVAGDTNNAFDVFLHDRSTSTTTRATLTSAGGQSIFGGSSPSLSDDGRIVAFSSISSDLVAGDTNGVSDIFVRDTVLATTQRVSVSIVFGESNGDSYLPWGGGAISADGRFVTFSSEATNLDTGDTNGFVDVFVHDRSNAVTRRVSKSSAGVEGNSYSEWARISGNGRFVTFYSSATNLDAADTNGLDDVYLHDRHVLRIDGCYGNVPELWFTSAAPDIATTVSMLHVGDAIVSGTGLLYIGADARDAAGCGTLLPEGEALINANGQPYSAPLASGVAVFQVSLPNDPSLVGAQVFLQSVGIDGTTGAFELANSLRMTISQ